MGRTSTQETAGARSPRHRGALAVLVAVALLALGGCIIKPGDPGPSDVRFFIDAQADVHPISPLIYGINGTTDLARDRPGLVRLGGNRWTAYNWENNASNAGSDWCYQNDGYLAASNVPGAAVEPTIEQAGAVGAATLLTMPIVDYVAADKNGGCDVRSTPNYLTTRMKQYRPRKGAALTTSPDAGDAYVNGDEFVHWVRSTEPGANVLFSLDNEPDLWSSTHPEVHPNPVTYAELAQRNIDYAKAIKDTWPAAKVAGPVSYGFAGFENLQGAPDAGGRNFLDWYLQQIEAAEVADNRQLVDYLDLHWYPEATGGGVRITGPETSAAVVAARVQAPRSLWDPSYTETSWITTDYGYGPIRLIPRMRDRFAAHDPGAQLAITEWNYGGGEHISGAVATADVLGVFGREQVGMAAMWPLNGSESYTLAAFRAFRSYDGAGGQFGDRSVRATSSDDSVASVYASKRSDDPKKIVIVAVNRSTTAKVAGIQLQCTAKMSRAKVFTITAAGGPNVVAQPDVLPVATNAWSYPMPPLSVSVIVPEV